MTYIDFSDDNDFDERFEELKYKILKVDRSEMEPRQFLPKTEKDNERNTT